MRRIQKHKALKILACTVLVVGLLVGIKVPAYAAAQCLNGDSPVASPSTDGQLTCPDGSTPCYNGINDSGTTPHCAPAPSGSNNGGSSSGGSSSSDGTVATCSDGSVAPLNNTDNCQTGGPHCGAAPGIHTAISIGCEGKGNPVMDMLFAIIRFLSAGVGIVVVASLIVAGVQYSASGGDPNAAKVAMHRIRSSLTALLVFIFAYAILNYILPGAILK